MPTLIKICGLTEEAGVDAAVAAGVDYVGFVFFARSPRCVSPARAAELAARLPRDTARIGLFVDPQPDEIAAALAAMRLDALQIYGGAALAERMRRRFRCAVWQPLGIAERADLLGASPAVEGLVIEAKAPKDATRPGGNAASFDWRLLRDWNPGRFWLLAGGLDEHNVAAAIRTAGPPAVDVSSGVESAPGIKDPARIARFVAAVRAA